MSVDESGAPWPYDEPREADDTEPPTWECPGGTCECHPVVDDAELVDHTIYFFDHHTERMPGARCRVLENGRMINLDAPFAKGDGSVSVRIKPTTRHLFLEWAPGDVPQSPYLPYRSRYNVTLGEDTHERVQLRLANLGFVAERDLGGNVADFERGYTYADPPTREPSSIETLLVGYHDSGALPPIGTKVPAEPVKSADKQLAPSLAKKGDENKKQAPAATPKQASTGSASSVILPKIQINLSMAFAVSVDDLSIPEKRTVEALADPEAILKEYGRLVPAKPQGIAIEKATLVAFSDGKELSRAKTGSDGWATLGLEGASPKAKVRIVAVPPDENETAGASKAKKKRLQLNPTNGPAAPRMPGADFTLARMFRLFVLDLTLDEGGRVALTPKGEPDLQKILLRPSDAPALTADGGIDPKQIQPRGFVNPRPKFVRIYGTQGAAQKKGSAQPPRLYVDWRPDWAKSENQIARYQPWDRFAPTGADKVPKEAAPAGIVVHHTHGVGMPGTMSGFLKKPAEPPPGKKKRAATSAHYLIDLDGHTIKLVDEDAISYHAGSSQWDGFDATNQFTVGFEIIHSDTASPGTDEISDKLAPREFFQEQYDALIRVCTELKRLFTIRPQHVIGHRDVSITGGKYEGNYPNGSFPDGRTHGGKPECPGMSFQWEQLEAIGLSLSPGAAPKSASTEDEKRAAALHKDPPALLDPKDTKSWKEVRGNDVTKFLLQCLFDIGYSVSGAKKHPKRADIKSDFQQLVAAGSAFQTHRFSGSRRHYNSEMRSLAPTNHRKAPRKAALTKNPEIRTIDATTIRAIIEAWWARKAAP